MSNINYIIPKNQDPNENLELITKQYLDFIIKQFEDLLTRTNYQLIYLDKSSESLNLSELIEQPKVEVQSINTEDSINMLKLDEKLSTTDFNTKIEEIKSDINRTINSKFNDILNNKDILDKLKLITSILNNCENADELLTQITSSVNEFLDNHEKSGLHLSSLERIALDKLLKIDYYADWNADKNTPNYILNRPDSLPANGGNAETLDGYSLEEVINHQIERLVIGSDNSYYTEKQVDVFLENGDMKDFLNTLFIENKSDDIPTNKILSAYGKISIREGKYYLPSDLKLNQTISELIFTGCGDSTRLHNGTVEIDSGICFNDLQFNNCVIILNKNPRFNNVIFKNCNISINDCDQLSITNCRFDNCVIVYTDRMYNSIITQNILNDSSSIEYIGGNNVVMGNVYCQ